MTLRPVTRAKPALLLLALLWSIYATVTAGRRYYNAQKAVEQPVASVRAVAGIEAGALRIGQKTAPVAITVFTNFDCAECKRLSSRLDSLIESFPTIAVSERFVVGRRPTSFATGNAVYCADQLGALQSVRQRLDRGATEIEDRNWGGLSIVLGIADTNRFARCVRESTFASNVRADSVAAAALRILGVPAIVVGDSLYGYALELDELKSRIQQVTAQHR